MTDSPAHRVVDLYQRHADSWDRQRGRTLFERAWLDEFLALVPAEGSVLDIGCGAGEPIARYIIERGFAVTGIDSSPAMIEQCRARFPRAVFQVGDMRALQLGERFAGLIAWDSFFHLTPDAQRAMFAIFAAHALPLSALLFTSGPQAGEVVGEFEGEPLYHASLSPAEYRSLLAENGYDVVSFTMNDAACGGHTVWLAQKKS